MIESWNELNPVADDSQLISVAEGLITVQISTILWYAPGLDPDFLWYFNQDGNYDSFQLTVNGHYAPFPADLEVF